MTYVAGQGCPEKCCTKCGITKPIEDFTAWHSYKDGRANQCKECRREYMRAYYVANRDDLRQRNAERERRERKARNAYRLRWAQENPDLERGYKMARRARKRGADADFIHPLVVLELDDGVCGICGTDVDPTAFDVDHIIPLSRGGAHIFSNVQVAHPRCNRSKGTRLL